MLKLLDNLLASGGRRVEMISVVLRGLCVFVGRGESPDLELSQSRRSPVSLRCRDGAIRGIFAVDGIFDGDHPSR